MVDKLSSIILINQIKNIQEKRLNQALKAQDITLSQAKALSILCEYPEQQMTLKDLEKKLDLAQSVTAGIVARLEQKKYVESFGAPDDKRIKIVRVTPLGEQKYLISEKALSELEETAFSKLTDGETQQLNSLLLTVRNTLWENA